MATNFPGSLDSLTNPTASDKLNSASVPHATQHSTLNDAVEALEAKVGVNGSAVTTSHDYLISKQSVVPYADASARTTAVPSPIEGQMSYLQDTNSVEVYNGSAWAAVGGLVLISRTTVGSAVSSVTVSNAFSSTYDNYRVIVGGVVTSANIDFCARLGAVTTGYKYARTRTTMAGTTSGAGSTSTGFLIIGAVADSAGYASAIAFDLYAPNLARATVAASTGAYGHPTVGSIDVLAAWEPSTTQHTDITILPVSGTMTGGTIDVYGYAKA